MRVSGPHSLAVAFEVVVLPFLLQPWHHRKLLRLPQNRKILNIVGIHKILIRQSQYQLATPFIQHSAKSAIYINILNMFGDAASIPQTGLQGQ